MTPQTNLWLLRAQAAVATVACFSIPWRGGVQSPIQKTGRIVFAKLQMNLTVASYLTIRGHDPLLQALRTPELPYHLVLLQHVLLDGFALWTDPALRKLLFQQCEVLLYPLQTLGEVKVNLLPWRLVFFGFARSSVFTLNHSSSGYTEGSDGGEEQWLLVMDGPQQPCDLWQRHFSGDLGDSLLGCNTDKEHVR